MADPAVANAAWLNRTSIFSKGEIIYQGLAWLSTPMVAQKAYPAGTTVMKFWDLRPDRVTATLRAGETVLIGGNPYEVTAFAAAGAALPTVTIAGPGLIEDMDWTTASRLMESPTKRPEFTLDSASGSTLRLKIPALWAYYFLEGCRFTYSGATVEASNGFGSDDFFFSGTYGATPDRVTVTTVAPVHAGVVDEVVSVEDELPAGAGDGQYRRGRTSAFYTEQDTTAAWPGHDIYGTTGVTRRTRTASFLGTLDLRPYLVPFPHTTDGLGFAYTEPNLVGCWIGGELYGIPTVLPTGYTPLRGLGEPAHMVNPYTSQAVTAGGTYYFSDSRWGLPRINASLGDMLPQHILMPTGYLESDWFPREPARAVQTRSIGPPLSGEKSVGWRNCQLTVNTIHPLIASPEYVIGYVDYATHLNEVVLFTGPLVSGATVDLGPLLPPLGQVKSFFFQASILIGGVRTRVTSAGYYTAKLAPRVDVPMPWDCFGDDTYRAGSGNLFARGGYHPAGVVPIPRTPLVSNASTFRMWDLHTLSPGGSRPVEADGFSHALLLWFRLSASVAGTYTLSKTGTASAFREYYQWMGQTDTLTASGTSVSIELSPGQDRFVQVGITASTDVVSLS